MHKIGGLISAIEDAGIRIKGVVWTDDEHLNIDVDEVDEERAGEAAQEYWRKQQEEHLEHIGLIAVPNE